MPHFTIATKEFLSSLVNKRPGETKLGEKIQTLTAANWEEQLGQSSARFVLLGIPEDMGVKANYGTGGSGTVFEPALKAIANVQSNSILDGSTLLLLGWFDFATLAKEAANMNATELRSLVEQIDDAVAPVIRQIIASKKIPVVIGGGHNNAYPLLKGASEALETDVNCINLDAHSDYRAIEGRHSGNGFRYARKNGYLHKYAVIAIHENYTSQEIINEFKKEPDLQCSFYEDIFVRGQKTFDFCINESLHHTSRKPRGIELDMDCIENALSSATTPCGISSLMARKYITQCAISGNAAYLHIAEGAARLDDGREDKMTAKLIAYLVTDFIKGVSIWD